MPLLAPQAHRQHAAAVAAVALVDLVAFRMRAQQVAELALAIQARIEVGVSERYLATSAGLILFLNLVEARAGGRDIRELFTGQPWAVRWAAYVGLVLSIINLGAAKAQSFIYFQF